MSIRGIDTQIMITRSPDFSKDTSSLQHRPEANQQNIAEQQKLAVALDQTRVAEMAQSEMDKLRTEEDGRGSNSPSGRRRGKQKENQEKEGKQQVFLVPPNDNLFDITV